MRPIKSRRWRCWWCPCLWRARLRRASEPALPVKVSENGRYFVDQKGRPSSGWAPRSGSSSAEYTLEDARTILEKTRANGFAFARSCSWAWATARSPTSTARSPGSTTTRSRPTRRISRTWTPWSSIARENNVVISMTLYHQRYRKCITLENARAVGEVAGPAVQGRAEHRLVDDARGQAGVRAGPARAGGGPARGRRRAPPHHLQAGPRARIPPASSTRRSGWTSTAMQTWKSVELIYPMVTKDYNLKPVSRS